MADIKKLSDEELDAEIARTKPQLPDPSKMSDADLDRAIAATAPAPQESTPGILSTVGNATLSGLTKVGQAVDSIGGAPTRAAISNLIDTHSPVEAAKAFGHQFAGDSSLAPTGPDIMAKIGVPDKNLSDIIPALYSDKPNFLQLDKARDDINLRQLTGVPLAAVADPLNFLPLGAVAKGVGKIAGKGLGFGSELAGAAIKSILPEGVKTVGGIAKESFENTIKSISSFVKPSLRPEFAKDAQTALQNNIPLDVLSSSVKYGEGSSISRLERGMAQELGGETKLKSHAEGLNTIRDAFDTKVSQIGGGVDPSLIAPTDAGDILKQGYNDARKDLFSQMDFTYRSAASQMPGVQLTDDAVKGLNEHLSPIISKAQSTAKNLALSPGTRAQAEQVLQVAQGIKQQAATGSYSSMVAGLQDLGQAFDSGVKGASDIAPDIKAYRNMYGGVSDALVKTVDANLGGDISKQLLDNNKAMTDWFRTTEPIADIISDSSKSPEAIYKSIIESGDTNKLRALKQTLPESSLSRLKAAFIENAKIADVDDKFSFARLGSKFQNDEKFGRVVKELFEPEEAQSLKDIILLGEHHGQAILNPSRTGELQNLRSPISSMRRVLENDQLLAHLKRSAELPSAPLEQTGEQLLNSQKARAAQSKPFMSADDFKRGKIDNAAKAAQITAITQYDEKQDFVSVPPEMVSTIASKVLNSGATNTEKARITQELNKSGRISQSIMDKLNGAEPVSPDAAAVLGQ